MQKSGRVDEVTFESTVLRGNRLGDPHVRQLYIYLPPEYDENSDRRYPVILMLSSHGNTAQSMLNWKAWGESIDQQVTRLISSGACPPHIVIIPDTWTRLGGALHLNSPAIGNYADYLLNEIIPYVDANYRTLSGGKHRGIMGRSSGGYAAIYHAMTRPGMFNAVADHSGDAYFEYMALPQIAQLHMNLARYGGLDGLMEDTKLNTPKGQAFFDTISTLTFVATFAHNDNAPHGFDLPIDLETGALRDDVWQRCLVHDPVRMIANPIYAVALKNVKELFIDCGQFDEYNLQVGARLVSQQLRKMGVPHTHEEYPGGHRGTHYRYDNSLPRLVRALLDS
jgi:enterochelin esterase-like enzyme